MVTQIYRHLRIVRDLSWSRKQSRKAHHSPRDSGPGQLL